MSTNVVQTNAQHRLSRAPCDRWFSCCCCSWCCCSVFCCSSSSFSCSWICWTRWFCNSSSSSSSSRSKASVSFVLSSLSPLSSLPSFCFSTFSFLLISVPTSLFLLTPKAPSAQQKHKRNITMNRKRCFILWPSLTLSESWSSTILHIVEKLLESLSLPRLFVIAEFLRA